MISVGTFIYTCIIIAVVFSSLLYKKNLEIKALRLTLDSTQGEVKRKAKYNDTLIARVAELSKREKTSNDNLIGYSRYLDKVWKKTKGGNVFCWKCHQRFKEIHPSNDCHAYRIQKALLEGTNSRE